MCDIKEKLKDNESFEVLTNSSTLSVRGTVFRVCLLQGNDNNIFDLVEVYDGKVLSNLDNSEESLSLEPGQCALIRENNNDDSKAASFVLAEDINDEFIKETGLNISLDQVEGGEKGTFKLSLDNASAETLSRLTTIIDEGTELAVEKEEIQEVKEKIEVTKEKPIKEQVKEEVKIEEKKEEKKETKETKEEVKCDHLNYQKETVDFGSCIREGKIHEICQDCGHVTVTNTGLNPYNHEHVTTYYDVPSCTDSFRQEYKRCDDCGTIFDEVWTGPHNDRDGDSICDQCGTSLSN